MSITKKFFIPATAVITLSIFASLSEGGSRRTATPTVPANLGGGLKALVQTHQAMMMQTSAASTKKPNAKAAAISSGGLTNAQIESLKKLNSHMKMDAQQRVLVNIYLDGSVGGEVMRTQLGSMGLTIVGEASWYRKGVFSAWMPLAQGAAVGSLKGVRSVHLEPGMRTRVGQTTSQGAAVMKADLANTSGYTGNGIKIGALSDTFNLNPAQDKNGIPDTSAYDVANGDLPVVEDVQDFSVGPPTDEGRGMLQLIHDVAPDAQLAFATANGTQVNFANNIRALGSPTSAMVPIVDPNTGAITNRPGLGCNIVCDDVIYFVEPMYSDGLIAQAIDDIATQYGVIYFSSAGNDGNEGYESDWRPIAAATGFNHAKVAESNHPALTGIPAAATYAGGWHNFNPDPNGPVQVVQKVTVGSADAPLVMQWNDPYDSTPLGTGPAGITTDYNILVFDQNGAYQSSMSGTDDNYSTNEPYEFPGTDLTAGGTFYICIVRANPPAGITPLANRFRYVAPTNGGGFSGDFINIDSPSIYGHTTAANCISTAAWVYDDVPNVDASGNVVAGPLTPSVEGFSSNGPVDIFFDRQGNRLAQGTRRRQPSISAPDGANTTFFPPVLTNVIPPGGGALPPPPVDPPGLPITIGKSPADYDGDGWPNFFGTSAAAPHAAGATALLLQAANDHGLGFLNPSYVRSLLQATTQGQMDTAPGFCAAIGNGPSGLKISLSASGDNPSDPNAFKVTFLGPTGYQLVSMTIDLRPSGLEFDPDPTHGAPFAQGSSTGGATLVLPPVLSNNNQVAALTFTSFDPGDSLGFGVDRDVAGVHAYGNGADQLNNSTFTATIQNNNTIPATTIQVNGTFANVYNQVYNFKSGYGLIDIQNAINTLLGQ